MNAAAITNNGNDISVDEFRWSMMDLRRADQRLIRDHVKLGRAGAEHQENRHARRQQAEE